MEAKVKDELLRLAAICEQAVGPDRELDVAIARVMRTTVLLRNDEDTANYETTHWRYTSSIDGALSLVPSDMRDEIEITTLYRVARVSINMNHGPDGSPFYGSNECNSIPLAICAAALKARASMEKTDG